jgi:hypothetical protein
MDHATFRIWRGDKANGGASSTTKPKSIPGMVVLDAVHQIQADQAQPTWPCAGTAKPASAAPAPPRSTACPS